MVKFNHVAVITKKHVRLHVIRTIMLQTRLQTQGNLHVNLMDSGAEGYLSVFVSEMDIPFKYYK